MNRFYPAPGAFQMVPATGPQRTPVYHVDPADKPAHQLAYPVSYKQPLGQLIRDRLPGQAAYDVALLNDRHRPGLAHPRHRAPEEIMRVSAHTRNGIPVRDHLRRRPVPR